MLIFFCGMFITVDGFNKTGIPSTLWDWVEPYSKINSASGVALFSVVVLILSNIASNVPTGTQFFLRFGSVKLSIYLYFNITRALVQKVHDSQEPLHKLQLSFSLIKSRLIQSNLDLSPFDPLFLCFVTKSRFIIEICKLVPY